MLPFLRKDFRVTKRQVGIVLLVVGALGIVGVLALDPLATLFDRLGHPILPADRLPGFGPQQILALALSAVLALGGLILLPLREPAVGPLVSLPGGMAQAEGGWRLAGRVLMILALALLVFYLVVFLVYAANIITFPFDYDQGEGFELVDTVMFSQFRWPYQNTEVFPFYSSNYPPLFHIIAAPFVWLFGPAYWYGRLLATLGTLLTAAVIGYAVYRAEGNRVVAVASGLAYLASNYIYHIGPLFRQHFVMVMFETLAVVVLATLHERMATRQRRRILWAGMILLLAAGYTKQLAISTVAAVFLYLFLENPRRAIGWGVIFAAIAGAIFLLIDRATGGQWWLNIITANVNPFVPGQFVGLLRQWISLHGVLLALAGLVVLYELVLDRLSLYSVWFIVSTAGTLLAGKWGAGDSYFATAIAGMCILSGIYAARTLRGAWRLTESRLGRRLQSLLDRAASRPAVSAGVAGVVVPALYLLYGVSVFHMPTQGAVFGPLSQTLGIQPNTGFAFYDSAGWTVGYAVLGQIPTEQEIANGWRLVDLAAEGDAPAISEDAAFSLLAGKPVVTNPTQLLNLYNNGLYDPSALIAMIEAQAFNVLILRADFYPEPVLEAMLNAYALAETIPMNGFEYRVYRPDPAWSGRAAD